MKLIVFSSSIKLLLNSHHQLVTLTQQFGGKDLTSSLLKYRI